MCRPGSGPNLMYPNREWKGANYVAGGDVPGHDTIMPYKNVGCDGPTLYRHNDGVNVAFYDGHVEYLKKDKVWRQEAYDEGTPGIGSTFRHCPPSEAEKRRLPPADANRSPPPSCGSFFFSPFAGRSLARTPPGH